MAKVLSALRLEVFVAGILFVFYAFSVVSFYVVVIVYVVVAMMPTPTPTLVVVVVVVVDVVTMLMRILNAVKESGC